MDNVDQNVGRLLEFLEKSGQLDNTLLMITSDNGANSIGGPTGVMNLQDPRQGFPEDAALVHRLMALQPLLQAINLDNWMLFNIANDPTEVRDLAASEPDVLRRLIEEFEGEATANYVYPIDNRDDRRAITVPPDELAEALVPRDFYPEGEAIHGVTVSPMIADRNFVLRSRFDWQTGDECLRAAMHPGRLGPSNNR